MPPDVFSVPQALGFRGPKLISGYDGCCEIELSGWCCVLLLELRTESLETVENRDKHNDWSQDPTLPTNNTLHLRQTAGMQLPRNIDIKKKRIAFYMQDTRNQPLKPANDQYIGILKIKINLGSLGYLGSLMNLKIRTSNLN